MSHDRCVKVYPGCEAVCEFDPDLTVECIDSCTWCCQHGVLLYDHDLLELAAHATLNDATTAFRDRSFVKREEKDWDAHTADDGVACYFLPGGRSLRTPCGRRWKPARCSILPLEIHRDGSELHVTVRDSTEEHCEGLDVNERRVIDTLDAVLPEILWDLPNPTTEIELSLAVRRPESGGGNGTVMPRNGPFGEPPHHIVGGDDRNGPA